MKPLKSATCAAFAAFVVAAPATAPSPAQAQGAQLRIKLFGDGHWTADCELDQEGGDVTKPRGRGRGRASSDALVGNEVVGGVCTATASDRGPLKLTLLDERGEFQCPFEAASGDDLCVHLVPAGQTFKFSVALN